MKDLYYLTLHNSIDPYFAGRGVRYPDRIEEADATLEHLHGLSKLRVLFCFNTVVTEMGMARVAFLLLGASKAKFAGLLLFSRHFPHPARQGRG